MSFVIEFDLPGLPPTTNGSHGHWYQSARDRKKWRQATRMVAYSRRPNEPLSKAKLTLTRFSSRRTDFDNLVISFKPIVDGLVDAKVLIDDTDAVVTGRKYLWEKAKERTGKVTIRVEEA